MQQPDKDPDGPYGNWESSPRRLISYRHLGCSSVVLDRDHAEGRMAARGDMRTPRVNATEDIEETRSARREKREPKFRYR